MSTRARNGSLNARQNWIDSRFRGQTAEAIRVFEAQRVPGVVYDTSSTVDAKGQLVITWTPRAS